MYKELGTFVLRTIVVTVEIYANTKLEVNMETAKSTIIESLYLIGLDNIHY